MAKQNKLDRVMAGIAALDLPDLRVLGQTIADGIKERAPKTDDDFAGLIFDIGSGWEPEQEPETDDDASTDEPSPTGR